MKTPPSASVFEKTLRSKDWSGLTFACELQGQDDPVWLYSISAFSGIRFFTNVTETIFNIVNLRRDQNCDKSNDILTVFLACLIAYDEEEDPKVKKVMSNTMTQFCLEFATVTNGWSEINPSPPTLSKHIVIVDWEDGEKAVCAEGTFHAQGFPGVDAVIDKAVEIYAANMKHPPYEIPL